MILLLIRRKANWLIFVMYTRRRCGPPSLWLTFRSCHCISTDKVFWQWFRVGFGSQWTSPTWASSGVPVQAAGNWRWLSTGSMSIKMHTSRSSGLWRMQPVLVMRPWGSGRAIVTYLTKSRMHCVSPAVLELEALRSWWSCADFPGWKICLSWGFAGASRQLWLHWRVTSATPALVPKKLRKMPCRPMPLWWSVAMASCEKAGGAAEKRNKICHVHRVWYRMNGQRSKNENGQRSASTFSTVESMQSTCTERAQVHRKSGCPRAGCRLCMLKAARALLKAVWNVTGISSRLGGRTV